MTELSEETRYAISKTADALAVQKTEEARLLKAIASDARHSSAKAIENKVLRFAGLSERNFLEGKRLSCVTSLRHDVSTYDPAKMGTTDIFPCTLSFEEGVWEFYLPPTPSVKNGKRGADVGRHIGYLTKNLLDTYIKRYGHIEMLKNPVAVFEYGFRKSDPLSKIYDADNRDNKRILDAMTGTFYPDDNILSVMTVHYGMLSEEEYTRVFIMERTHIAGFLSKNSQR